MKTTVQTKSISRASRQAPSRARKRGLRPSIRLRMFEPVATDPSQPEEARPAVIKINAPLPGAPKMIKILHS